MMEKVYDYIISGHDTDYFHVVSPSTYVKIAQTGSYRAQEAVGLNIWQMKNEMDATLMTGSVGLKIFRDIHTVGVMEVFAAPMVVNGVLITQQLEICRDGVAAARAEINTMAVNLSTRKVMRPESVMEYFHIPVHPGVGKPPRLILPQEMTLMDKLRVRYYDCDHNQHLRASNYVNYACDVTGYWAGTKPKHAKELFIEYLGECRVGDELSVYMAPAPKGHYVQGIRSDGHASFKCRLIAEE